MIFIVTQNLINLHLVSMFVTRRLPQPSRAGTGMILKQVQVGHESTQKRSEEHTSELQSPVPISYAVFCLKKKIKKKQTTTTTKTTTKTTNTTYETT